MIVPSGQAPGGPTPTRRVAVILWSALLGGSVLFAAIATVVGPDAFWGKNDAIAPALSGVAVGMSIVTLALSRIVPPRVKPPPGATPDALGVTRTVVASALNEGGALNAVVAWLLTGAGLAALSWAISVGGLLLAFPSEARWRRLTALQATTAPPNRLVR